MTVNYPVKVHNLGKCNCHLDVTRQMTNDEDQNERVWRFHGGNRTKRSIRTHAYDRPLMKFTVTIRIRDHCWRVQHISIILRLVERYRSKNQRNSETVILERLIDDLIKCFHFIHTIWDKTVTLTSLRQWKICCTQLVQWQNRRIHLHLAYGIHLSMRACDVFTVVRTGCFIFRRLKIFKNSSTNIQSF